MYDIFDELIPDFNFESLSYNFSILKSQDSQFYDNNVHSLLTSIDTFSDSYNTSGKYALKTLLTHKLEWDNDFASIYLSCDGCENDTLLTVSGHNVQAPVAVYNNYIESDVSTLVKVYNSYGFVTPINLLEESSNVNIVLSTDETLDYSGVMIRDFDILFKPDGECFKGDIYLDGSIDVNDIVIMVNIIFEDYGFNDNIDEYMFNLPNFYLSNIIYCTSDMNSNEITIINDIVILVETILYN